MVVNPKDNWDSKWLTKIDVIEKQLIHKGQEHICGHPTRGGTPCMNRPTEIGDQIHNGRCSVHGGMPEIKHAKKSIVSRRIDFMYCDKCDIHTQLEGLGCPEYKAKSTCSIEAELYDRINKNLRTLYKFEDYTAEVMLDSLIRDFVRRDRAWRLENAIGSLFATKARITDYYERATENVVKWFRELGLINDKSKGKSISDRMRDLSSRTL